MNSSRSDRRPHLSFETIAKKNGSRGLILSVTRISLTIFFWLCFGHAGVALEPPPHLAQTPTAETQATKKVIFVNSSASENGDGSASTPFKTITQALQQAGSDSIIKLAAGTYSRESGEKFPLRLKPRVTLQGDSSSKGSNIIIKGGGMYMSPTFARQDVAILGADDAVLMGVTVTNSNPRGYGLWIESSSPTVTNNTFTGSNHDGISVTGDSAPIVRNNRFIQNGANGITIYGISKPEIRENVFEQTGYGINVAQRAAPLIAENRIINNRTGVVSQAFTKPVLRNNIIEGNKEDGVVAIANSQPDLGTSTEPGNNQFRQNGRYDINSSAAKRVTISAVGNQVAADRSIGNIDFAGTSDVIASNSGVVGADSRAPVRESGVGKRESGVVGAGSPEKPTNKPTIPSNLPAQELRERGESSSIQNPKSKIQNSPAPRPVLEVVEIPVPPPDSELASVQKKPNQKPKQLSAPKPSNPKPQNQPQNIATASTAELKPEVTKAPTANNNKPPTSNTKTEVEIPVTPLTPPPKGDTITQSLPTLKPASANPSELLPVPNGDIPSGNDRPSQVAAVSSPSANSATANGLRYRVVVEATNTATQEKVRSLVPGSFRIFTNGKTIMQAGAFSDRAKADEVVQLLTSNGLKAKIEQMN
jgi:parallel beta-helix repeat protein